MAADGVAWKMQEIALGGMVVPVAEPVIVVTGDGNLYGGTAENDVLTVDLAVVGLVGYAGDDTLTGSDRSDVLYGDNAIDWGVDLEPPSFDPSAIGNDVLYGRGGRDALIGGPGNDTLFGGLGDDLFAIVDVDGADDTWFGGDGKDTLYLSLLVDFGFNEVRFNQLILDATVSIEAINSDAQVLGTVGDDTFDLSGVQHYLGAGFPGGGNFVLEDGNDRFSGGAAPEAVNGAAGNDTLNGGAGRDYIIGGSGEDRLLGGDGSDTLIGSSDLDTLIGGAGNDFYSEFDAQEDAIFERAAGGYDEVTTWSATFTLGRNIEAVRFQNPISVTGTGNVIDNRMYGGFGDDTLFGRGGDDFLCEDQISYISSDRFYGGSGDDTLNGGAGFDRLFGGGGADVFRFDVQSVGGRADRIFDFEVGMDRIALLGGGLSRHACSIRADDRGAVCPQWRNFVRP
jgi:Ca2+-binding RTX toxin-like protein